MASYPTENRPLASISVVTHACLVGLKKPPATLVLRLRNIQPKVKGGVGSAPAMFPPCKLMRCASRGKQVSAPPVGGGMLSPWKHRSAGCSCSSNATTSAWFTGTEGARGEHEKPRLPRRVSGGVPESRHTSRSVPPVDAPPLMYRLGGTGAPPRRGCATPPPG